MSDFRTVSWTYVIIIMIIWYYYLNLQYSTNKSSY
jgi:hypothetical protein